MRIEDAQLEALERVLRELLVEHERLVDLAGRHREALRRADGLAVTAISIERDAVNERLVALNDERVRLIGELARALGAEAASVTVRTVIEAAGPGRSARLAGLADELRSAVEATRREHSVLREATAALAGHLGGVLDRAVQLCAPARTYTASGRVSVASTMPGALDVRH